MAELADALDLGSSIERCAGSIPVSPIIVSGIRADSPGNSVSLGGRRLDTRLACNKIVLLNETVPAMPFLNQDR